MLVRKLVRRSPLVRVALGFRTERFAGARLDAAARPWGLNMSNQQLDGYGTYGQEIYFSNITESYFDRERQDLTGIALTRSPPTHVSSPARAAFRRFCFAGA